MNNSEISTLCNCYSSFFRCRDDISNFKVRVKVKRVILASSSTAGTEDDDEDEESISPTNSVSTSAQWIGSVTFGWQEKIFSPAEEVHYRKAKEEDFHGNVLKKKFYKDVQEAKKRSKTLGQKIFTCLDGELYENDEVGLFLKNDDDAQCGKN